SFSPPVHHTFSSNATATPELYTLSLHALFRSTPRRSRQRDTHSRTIDRGCPGRLRTLEVCLSNVVTCGNRTAGRMPAHDKRFVRSEEHTSELQSRGHLVCRLLLEKKKTHIYSL